MEPTQVKVPTEEREGASSEEFGREGCVDDGEAELFAL